MISGHGDDRFNYTQAIHTDFSSNVWFGGTAPELITNLQENLHLIGHYPEPDSNSLCREIAGYHQVDAEHVLSFNGSIEAFYTIALAYRKAVSAILYPAFAEYEDACRMHRHIPSFFRKNEWKAVLTQGANLVWIGNPNNPDGSVFSRQQLEDALKNYPNTIFVIDEAYAAFVPDFESSIPLTSSYHNLMVVRSLTKCCAIPGLRLGYVVASQKIASRLRKFQQPWSVNVLAQEAGKFLLHRLSEHPLDSRSISKTSAELQHAIGLLNGFRVHSSPAPFFLIELKSGTATELKQFLIEQHGILIRDASNFRGLNERFFRVCTRNAIDNQLLIDGLRNYSKTINHSECGDKTAKTELKIVE